MISCYGMAKVSKMHPNLMGSAGFYMNLNKSMSCEPLFTFPIAYCVPAISFAYRHFLSMNRMPADRRHYAASIFRHDPAYQSKVVFFNLAILELVHQMGMGGFGAGDDHHSGGILVEPVDNTGTVFISDLTDIVVSEQETVYQGIVNVTASRMNHKSWGLGNYQIFRIFFYDFK